MWMECDASWIISPRIYYLQMMSRLEQKAAVNGVRWDARSRRWVASNMVTGPVLAMAMNDYDREIDTYGAE